MPANDLKSRMADFVASRLEDSGFYVVQSYGNQHLLVAEKTGVVPQPRTIDLLLHSSRMTKDGLSRIVAENGRQGIYTTHVFLKDGETFMVRLGARGNIKDERSLKNYTKQKIDAMIDLRDLEKLVAGMTGDSLSYYQPETERLDESVRIFRMAPVRLDYSHLQGGDNGYGFARNTDSTDYKLPVEIAKVTAEGALRLSLLPALRHRSALLRQAEPVTRVKPEQLALF